MRLLVLFFCISLSAAGLMCVPHLSKGKMPLLFAVKGLRNVLRPNHPQPTTHLPLAKCVWGTWKILRLISDTRRLIKL